MHERIWKSQALGTKKQGSSSSICKYNLLRKADTLLESLYRPEKVYTIKKKKMYIIN